jgi:nucleolar MIF4G domain-containing protein 1
MIPDLLNFVDSVAFGKSSKSKGKGKEVVSAFDSEDDDMDGLLDMEDDEGSMMSFGSGQEDTAEEEDDFISDDGDVDEEDDLDDSMEEDDDLAQFLTEDEDDESEDEELRRNTAENARTANSESETTAVDVPAPAPVAAAPTTGKYVPPSLRKLQQQATAEVAPSSNVSAAATKTTEQQPKTEQQIKLERKTQGLLNKLSEANIESILAEVEGLYREWSRNGKCCTLRTDHCSRR